MSDAQFQVGVDVGGTNLRVGVVSRQAVIWESRRVANFSALCQNHPPAEVLAHLIDALIDVLEDALERFPHASSVGIGFPGFIHPRSHHVLLSPNLPGLKNFEVAGPVAQRLGLPVRIINDALAAAYGEYLFSDPASESLLYLGLGTGVGGGLVLNGRPYQGEHGVAMEAGHLIVKPGGRLCGCGNRGCLEQYASAHGLALTYRELTQTAVDADEIAKRAKAGDPHAQAAFQLAAEMLAVTLAHILKVVDITRVILGGGMSNSWSLMQPVFERHLDQQLIPALRGLIDVQVSRKGDQAGILGAACWPGE